MTTATESPSESKAGLSPEEKGWLTRYIGTRVPWKMTIVSDGGEIDAAEALERLKEYEKGVKAGEEFEGTYPMEMQLLRNELAAIGIPSKVDRGENFDAARTAKDDALKQVRDLIELEKAEINKATDLTFTVKRKTLSFLTKKKKTKKDGQAVEEFSATHEGDRVVAEKGPTPEQLKACKLVISQLEGLTQQLRDKGDSDFSPNELMEEVWTPLVREQIISEHQCPNEFSRVLQLWQGANALYKERCKAKAREEEEAHSGVRAALNDLDEALGVGAAVADVILSALGTGAKSQEILKLVSKCSRAGVNLISKGLAKDLGGCSSEIGNILAAAVPDPWGKVSQSAFLAASNGGLIAQKLAQRDNTGAADLFGTAIGQAFKAIGASVGKAELFDHIGGGISHAVTTAIESKAVFDLLQAEPVDPKAVLAAIGKISSSQIKLTVEKLISEVKQPKDKATYGKELENKGLKKDDDEYEKLMAKFEKSQEAEGESWGAALDKLKELIPDQEAIDQQALAGSDQINAELEESHQNYSKSLGIVMGVGAGADEDQLGDLSKLYDIDALIAQMEADQAQIALLNAIIDAVGGVLTLIVPQLGGVLKAKQFAMNVVAAVRRSQELITFSSLVSDAKKATSPQAYTLLAQVDELKHQLTNDTIEAALSLGQTICINAAAAADLSGIGAAAGAGLKAASGGLEAMKQAKDLLYRKFKERKVKRAWQRYRQALDNPEDRIAIIKAIRKNPTLSKYALAYGALEMNDPFAKEALRECNLTDAVLANENTNADKVVRFLEVKFSDDIQVVGVISTFAPDSGDPLTLDSWVKNKNAAMGKPKSVEGQVLLAEKPPTNSIDAAFAAIEQSGDAIDDGDLGEATSYAPWTTHAGNLAALAVALRSFKPQAATGGPYNEFQDYLNELAFAVEAESKRVLAQIEADRAARERAVTLFTETINSATLAIQAVQTAKASAGAATTARPPQEIIDFCATGGGKTLLGEAKKLAATSPAIGDAVDVVVQALTFTAKRAENAKKAAIGGKTAEAGTAIRGAIETLLNELDDAVTAFGVAESKATAAKTAMTISGP